MINHKQERGKKKSINSYFCDGRTFKVYGVEGSTFAPVWVWFSLFLKPGDFFNITSAISLRINSFFKNTRDFIQSKEKSLSKKGWHSKNGTEDLFWTPNI